MKSKQRENIIKPNPKRKMAGEAFVWTPEEETHIRNWYGKRHVRQIARELGRGYRAVVMRAAKLGVSKPRRSWTSAELRKLRSLRTHQRSQIAVSLGHTVQEVKYQMRRLGLHRFRWNPEEERYLKKWYRKKTKKEIARRLARSIGSVFYRAKILNLGSKPPPRWTAEEDRFLAENYYRLGSLATSKVLGRTRAAVVLRAKKHRHARRKKKTARQR